MSAIFAATRLLIAASPVVAAPTAPVTHVIISEELDADRVRSLVRPAVVVWLETRSNAPKTSVLEALSVSEEAFVHLRPPLAPGHLAQLDRAKRLGIWIDGKDAASTSWNRLAGRPFAVELKAPVDAATWSVVRRLRPVRTRLSGPVDLAAVASLAQLPGAKVVAAEAVPCVAPPRVRFEVPVASLFAVDACDAPVVLDAAANLDSAKLARALAAHADVQFVVTDRDEAEHRRVRAFLDRLGGIFRSGALAR